MIVRCPGVADAMPWPLDRNSPDGASVQTWCCVPQLCGPGKRGSRLSPVAPAAEVRYQPEIYHAWVPELTSIIRELPDTAATVLVLGHAPGIPDLVEFLAVRDHGSAHWARMDEKFPTAALAVLAVTGPWSEVADRARRWPRSTSRGVSWPGRSSGRRHVDADLHVRLRLGEDHPTHRRDHRSRVPRPPSHANRRTAGCSWGRGIATRPGTQQPTQAWLASAPISRGRPAVCGWPGKAADVAPAETQTARPETMKCA